MTCRRYPMCPPEGCWADNCAVDQPDDGPGSYPPADPVEATDKRLHASPEHDGRTVTWPDDPRARRKAEGLGGGDLADPERYDLSPRCWNCNAVLPDDGECTDPDCLRAD